MALSSPEFRVDVPQDWDAGLREKILSCISDPKSGVIQFPARTNPHRRLRRASLSTIHYDLIPRPHTQSDGRNYRVAKPLMKRKMKMPPILVYVSTIVASLVIGGGIGLLALQPSVQMQLSAFTAAATVETATAPTVLSSLSIDTFAAPASETAPYVTAGQAATVTSTGMAADDTTLALPAQ